MKQDLTTIPIGEVFEPRDGCPLCRLRDLLETRVTDYITGAAMMEPDIRIETNAQGFCLTHYRQMLKKRNRLSVALTMESRLDELDRRVFGGLPVGREKRAAEAQSTCFVCREVDGTMDKMTATVCRQWEADRDFRALFSEQPFLCLPHYTALIAASSRMSRKGAAAFGKEAAELCRGYLQTLREDVHHFTTMFDYRNSGPDADWGNSRDAIERTVTFLTGRDPDGEG